MCVVSSHSPWRRASESLLERTLPFMGRVPGRLQFAYLKTTEKAINSNLNNVHAQNYVYGLPADKFMGASGDQASDTE